MTTRATVLVGRFSAGERAAAPSGRSCACLEEVPGTGTCGGRTTRTAIILALALTSVGCGDDDGATTTDAGLPRVIEDLPIEQELSLSCVTGAVDIVQDDRGMWHIYGESTEDVFCAQGYLMARDRMAQMELFRRSVTGRLAELTGSIVPALIEQDIAARFMGHVRNAQRAWDRMSTEERGYVEAYAAGVNAYIAQLKADEVVLPRGSGLVQPEILDEWTPLDTLAIGGQLAARLTYTASSEVYRTERFAAWLEAFPSSGGSDTRLAARADAFHDLFPFTPTRLVFTRDGFPNIGTDTGTRALRPPPSPAARSRMALPSRGQLAAAVGFTRRIDETLRLFGDETRGSNSWVIHGSKTASGNPILANDPHLDLPSPPLLWMVHLNTARAGGDMDVHGLALTGVLGVVWGVTAEIAWGFTTHNFDVNDAYLETITPGSDGAPDTVELDGAQVAIETIAEIVEVDGSPPRNVTFEVVPHHGLIIPGTRTATSAISVRWTGSEPHNLLRGFLDLYRATTIEDIQDALESFTVTGQNVVAITRGGNIFWSTQCALPVRDPRALTYDPATRMGYAPSFVLPGTGQYEWTGYLDDRYIPHSLDPGSGFIATANNDAVGVSADGNPFNDPHYIGWLFDSGNRIARITELLEPLVAGGAVTPDDMQAVQADAQSPFGRLLTAAMVAELDRAVEEAAASGTHSDLADAVAAVGPDRMGGIAAMRDRLASWDFETSEESIPATIFNAALPRLNHLLVDDELEAIGGDAVLVGRLIVNALTDPGSMASYDATIGDTVLWDDLRTDVVETRGIQVLAAFLDALAFLSSELGADMDEWEWGRLHTFRARSSVPQTGSDHVSIPPSGSTEFPNGFPRHGDNETVDPAGFGLFSTESFTYSHGAIQRLVVEMTPEGPVVRNAIPGGQSIDPDSPHHADEIEHWRRNEAPPLYFHEPDVVAHAERRLRVHP